MQRYRFDLPLVDQVFRPGHRLMVPVQIQSSCFPPYDRNLRTYVENIFRARAADYRTAAQRVLRARYVGGFIELPVAWPRGGGPTVALPEKSMPQIGQFAGLGVTIMTFAPHATRS